MSSRFSTPSPNVVIIDNHDSFTYNIADYLARSGVTPLVLPHSVDVNDIIAHKPCGIILSPGPGHAEDPAAYGCCAAALRHFSNTGTPVLGICLGHQLIASQFAAKIVRTDVIRHGWISNLTFEADAVLFRGLRSPFAAMRYHSYTVKADSLPDEYRIVAISEEDACVMAIEHRTLPIFGVQFHPESIGTTQGLALLGNFADFVLDSRVSCVTRNDEHVVSGTLHHA